MLSKDPFTEEEEKEQLEVVIAKKEKAIADCKRTVMELDEQIDQLEETLGESEFCGFFLCKLYNPVMARILGFKVEYLGLKVTG